MGTKASNNPAWNKWAQIAIALYITFAITPYGHEVLGELAFFNYYSPKYNPFDITVYYVLFGIPLIFLLLLRHNHKKRILKEKSDTPAPVITVGLIVWLIIGIVFEVGQGCILEYNLGYRAQFYIFNYMEPILPVFFEEGVFSPGFVFIWGILPFLLITLLILALRQRPEGANIFLRHICAGVGIALLAFSWAAMAGTFLIESVPGNAFYCGYYALFAAIPLVFASWYGWKGLIPFAILFSLLFYLFKFFYVIPVIKKDYPIIKPLDTEEDDLLEEKNPPFDPDFTKGGLNNDYLRRFYINESDAVIELKIARVTEKEKEPAERIYPTFRKAVQAAKNLDTELLPSVEMVDAYGKYLDDRILAAIELHIHRGSSIFIGGKQGFLAALLKRVLTLPVDSARDEAAAFLAAAIELGGDRPDIPDHLRDEVKWLIDRFKKNPDLSKPTGFYTKTRDLTQIFLRDRFLQRPFAIKEEGTRSTKPDGFCAGTSLAPMVRIALALDSDPALRDAYTRFRRLAERLCNPDANLNIDDMFTFREQFSDFKALIRSLKSSQARERTKERGNINPSQVGIAFWPFATSKEAQLFAKLYGGSFELPPTEVMGDLVASIRNGSVDLAPNPESGWYDHQLYALETLLLTDKAKEAPKLFLRRDYKKILRKAFTSMMTKRRETHVKDLFTPVLLCTRFDGSSTPPYPSLSVQPCATTYLRTARAYRFLASEIRRLLGTEQISTIEVTDLKGSLDHELRNAAILFYGLYIVVCNDLCMIPSILPGELEGLVSGFDNIERSSITDEFQIALSSRVSDSTIKEWYLVWKSTKNWLDKAPKAKFLTEDQRLIVPVLGNASRTKYRYWSILGTRLVKIEASYIRPPRTTHNYSKIKIDETDQEKIDTLRRKFWTPKEYLVPVNVFEEVTLGPRPLSRKEFQAICDRGDSKEDILEMLTKGTRSRFPTLIVISSLILLFLFIIVIFVYQRRRNN